jgi:hypothetical protein
MARSGEIDSTMEQLRPLSCLIRSARDRANKWYVVSSRVGAAFVVDFDVSHNYGQLLFMDIHPGYPIRHRLSPGGSGERAGDHIFERRWYGSNPEQLQRLAKWLMEQQAEEVVMESTAQYWKPLWSALARYWKPPSDGNSPLETFAISIKTGSPVLVHRR